MSSKSALWRSDLHDPTVPRPGPQNCRLGHPADEVALKSIHTGVPLISGALKENLEFGRLQLLFRRVSHWPMRVTITSRGEWNSCVDTVYLRTNVTTYPEAFYLRFKNRFRQLKGLRGPIIDRDCLSCQKLDCSKVGPARVVLDQKAAAVEPEI